MITVILSSAMICVGSHCEPALVGKASTPTPMGVYRMQRALIANPAGYQGDDLYALATLPDGSTLAIHRTYTGVPAQKREWRIEHGTPDDRKISNGCINVRPALFEQIKSMCGNFGCTVEIVK